RVISLVITLLLSRTSFLPLSLHDALPISTSPSRDAAPRRSRRSTPHSPNGWPPRTSCAPRTSSSPWCTTTGRTGPSGWAGPSSSPASSDGAGAGGSIAHRRPGTALAPPTNNHRYMSGPRIGPAGSWEHPPHRRAPPAPGTALAPPTNNHRYMSGQRIGPVGSWEHPPDRRAPPHTAAAAYGTDAGFRRREAWRPMAADLDIITFGRSGVDIYPLEIEKGLEDIHSFGKFLGGSPMNVAVAAARLGHNPGVITGVGDDPFGRYVVKEMERLGVDSRFVVTDHEHNTPI